MFNSLSITNSCPDPKERYSQKDFSEGLWLLCGERKKCFAMEFASKRLKACEIVNYSPENYNIEIPSEVRENIAIGMEKCRICRCTEFDTVQSLIFNDELHQGSNIFLS